MSRTKRMSGSSSTSVLPGRHKSLEREEGDAPASSGGVGHGERRPTSTSSLAAVRHMARKQSSGGDGDGDRDPGLDKMHTVPRKGSNVKDKGKGVPVGDAFLLTPITHPRRLDSDEEDSGDEGFGKVTKGKTHKTRGGLTTGGKDRERRVSGVDVDVGIALSHGHSPHSARGAPHDAFPVVKKGLEKQDGDAWWSPTEPVTPRKEGTADQGQGRGPGAVNSVSPMVAPPTHVTSMSSGASLSTTKVRHALVLSSPVVLLSAFVTFWLPEPFGPLVA